LASEIREARLAAGLGQRQVARAADLSQSVVSRIERNARPNLSIDEAAVMCAILGLRLHVKAYPAGSPVRDAAQLGVAARLRSQVSDRFAWRTEVPIGGAGDLRAWDVCLSGPATIGIDIETRLQDMQALQRRLELKLRDSDVDRVVLVVAGTRHNRAVIREHRGALSSTLPLDTAEVMAALRSGEVPRANGLALI
jgi:transcriptional regulator with XRE-family HTH domain